MTYSLPINLEITLSSGLTPKDSHLLRVRLRERLAELVEDSMTELDLCGFVARTHIEEPEPAEDLLPAPRHEYVD